MKDIHAIPPNCQPFDGWDAIHANATPRPRLTSLLDQLDVEYKSNPGKFVVLNQHSLSERE